MNSNDYIAAAMRTNSTSVGTHGRASIDLLHAASGLITEIDELAMAVRRKDADNATEELGDLCWYAALACHAMDIDWPFVPLYMAQDPPELHSGEALNMAIMIIDMAKKYFAYGKPVDRERASVLLSSIMMHASALSTLVGGQPVAPAMRANIAKLRERFPDRFTNEAAINRQPDAEMNVVRQASRSDSSG